MDGFAARISLPAAAFAALLSSCGADEGSACDREHDPVVTYSVEEAAGCVDFSPAGGVVIGCRTALDIVQPLNTCYRSTVTGQLVFSYNIYPHIDPGWVEEVCSYSHDDACP